MMQHKGYVGVARIDEEAGVIRGRVINTRDMITFQGKTVDEAREAFIESVEDYLEFCASRGEEPDRPFSGNFPVRTTPEIHRALALEATRRGVSLNQLVSQALAREATRTPESIKPPAKAPGRKPAHVSTKGGKGVAKRRRPT